MQGSDYEDIELHARIFVSFFGEQDEEERISVNKCIVS